MRIRWPLLATFLTIGLAYVAYPYVTLYRLGSAMQTADASSLEKLVDWPAVREGIKEDICDLVVDDSDARTGAKLPAFGASFIRGIASSTIDRQVTPQGIVSASLGAPHREQAPTGQVRVNWAFFESPTVFNVDVNAAGLSEPIRMEMDLRGGEWRVRRVWLPVAMLSGSPDRT